LAIQTEIIRTPFRELDSSENQISYQKFCTQRLFYKERVVEMKSSLRSFGINRRALLSAVAALPLPRLLRTTPALAQDAGNQLASWNDGPAKQAIMDFVRATTDHASPKFVPPEERIATFDQDGTLWVEHPMYTQVVYCLERVPAVVEQKPELGNQEPFSRATAKRWPNCHCTIWKKSSLRH
jgi:hypothetical protein